MSDQTLREGDEAVALRAWAVEQAVEYAKSREHHDAGYVTRVAAVLVRYVNSGHVVR